MSISIIFASVIYVPCDNVHMHSLPFPPSHFLSFPSCPPEPPDANISSPLRLHKYHTALQRQEVAAT